MKRIRLLIGIFVGGILACILLVLYSITTPEPKSNNNAGGIVDSKEWDWPSSLDALIAAPGFHKLIFENDEFRIMEVTLNPGQLDPIHTHKGKSIVWIISSSPIVYTTYGKGKGKNLIPIKKDTIIFRPDELHKANWENPEPPHSVENIGIDTFRLYRIEYKEELGIRN